MFVNIFIILSSPTKKLSANRNNNYHFSNLFINSVPIQNFIIYQTNTKIFLSFYTRKEQIINYKPPQQSKQSKYCHFLLLAWWRMYGSLLGHRARRWLDEKGLAISLHPWSCAAVVVRRWGRQEDWWRCLSFALP